MLRLPLDNLCAGERVLGADAVRYLLRVHRLGVGARVLAFDPAARLEAEAEIVTAGAKTSLRLAAPRAGRAVPGRDITVIQAASKGVKIDGVVRDATELAATRFVVAVCERSVKRPDRAGIARWRRVAIEAARQCGRGDLPEIVGPLPWAEAIRGGGGLVLHPGGEPFASAAPRGGSATVAIGPEGGFSDAEIADARAAGYRTVSLGPFVMRAETACAAALGALHALE